MKSGIYLLLLMVVLLITGLSIEAAKRVPPSIAEGSNPDKHVSFAGTWKNQRGSLLTLQSAGSDLLKGYFTTAVANTQACIGKEVPVQAVHNSNSFALSLSMKSCGSPVTIAISGLLRKSETRGEPDKIDTMALIQWHGQETWKSRVITNDTFMRVSE
ncbi:avidin/streptavidin family protein [Endozoicomonas elysicola]|uniref:Uncharacterized protein n=1 Tax=Endozoicomonas elysicola TaxID=305900 RepID=A0A081KFT1_9GAMM|nr:avidin/streptavidin family protein [Endozoicomonas elysicola]KEI73007.1 hypothetical protein GV64_21845 [Endozoicomonas elysicola]